MANNTSNPAFNKAIADADAASKSSDATYLELFFEAFENVKGDGKLASPEIFANKALSDEVNFQMSDDEVKPIIRRKIDESIVSAFEVLRERIDALELLNQYSKRVIQEEFSLNCQERETSTEHKSYFLQRPN